MNWKDYLKERGFEWSYNNENMQKSIGFGNKKEVTKMMKGLFEIKKYGKVEFSHFIDSFEQFKKIINSIIK